MTTYAHSGRTDSSGGHRDNKNASGLGSYHYHCGGYPAHLHENGICPYSSSSSTKSSSSSSSKSSTNTKSTSSSSSSKSTTSNKKSTVSVKSVEIDEIKTMEVGDDEKLIATVTPSNATNKNITWKSSDKSIAEVDKNGNITAKKPGTVYITASTSNGKEDEIKITIKDVEKEISEVKTSNVINNTLIDNELNNEETEIEESNSPVGWIVTIAIACAGVSIDSNNYNKDDKKN